MCACACSCETESSDRCMKVFAFVLPPKETLCTSACYGKKSGGRVIRKKWVVVGHSAQFKTCRFALGPKNVHQPWPLALNKIHDGKKDPSAAPAPDIATRSVPRSSSGPDPMVSVRQWPLVASANAAAPRRPPLPLVTVGIELETDSPDTKYFMLTASGDVERARDVERSYFWSSI